MIVLFPQIVLFLSFSVAEKQVASAFFSESTPVKPDNKGDIPFSPSHSQLESLGYIIGTAAHQYIHSFLYYEKCISVGSEKPY